MKDLDIMKDENSAKRNELIEIVARLTNGESYIDDHDNSEANAEGICVSDTLYVCPVFYENGFCLNPLYIEDDGKIHLSASSIGGTFRRGDIRSRLAIRDYNTDCGPKLKGGRIISVTWFY